jgi:hypothetical protein
MHYAGGEPCKFVDSPSRFLNLYGRSYGLQRPYFVRDASWVSSLCPTCHTMRLLLEGFGSLVFDARKAENTCVCQWCVYHRKGAGSVPRTCSELMGEVFCPKKPTQPGSGFATPTYPTFDLCCLKQYLTAKQQNFVVKAMGDNIDAVARLRLCDVHPCEGAQMAIFQISGPEGTENAQNRALRGLAATRLAIQLLRFRRQANPRSRSPKPRSQRWRVHARRWECWSVT